MAKCEPPEVNARAVWTVVPLPPPQEVGTAEVPAMRDLSRRHLNHLIAEGVYTAEEVAAYSGRIRSPVPGESDHPFRWFPITPGRRPA